jgi:hypothetical protein
MLMIGVIGSTRGATHQSTEAIPSYTPELEARLRPPPQPLVAIYRRGDRVLAFVGARHVFTSQNSTLRAIDSAFAAVSPAIVVLEGFPTAMGANPPPLVEEARRYGTPEADDYAKGEPMYAASLALARGIPFIGGEPTREEQVQALIRRGYTPKEIFFVYLVGDLKGALRAHSLASVEDPKLLDTYEFWSQAAVSDYKLDPMSFEEFSTRYRTVYGVEITRDAKLAERPDGGTSDDPTAPLQQDTGVIRDEQLLATIEKLLMRNKRMVVIYGSNHWVTLSEALKKRLGVPIVTSYH